MLMVRHIKVAIIQGRAPAVVVGNVVDEHTVRAACGRAIGQAMAAGFSVVVLPPVGCDAGFPLIASAKIMSQEVLRVARDARLGDALREIVISLPSEESFQIFEKQVFGYLRHIMEDLAWGPYITTDIIIEMEDGIILIERTNPPFGWACVLARPESY